MFCPPTEGGYSFRQFSVNTLVKLPRSDRLALIFAGSLLLVSLSGCASSRNQTTAENRPQDTTYGSNPYRRAAPQVNPGHVQDPDYAADEYPDFRGKRAPYATGDGTGSDGPAAMPGRQQPPAAQSDSELVEPLRFPGEAEPAGANAADRRSFRGTFQQKMAGLWNRQGSSKAPGETAAQAPLAAGAAPSGWNVRFDDLRRGSANFLPEESAVSDTGWVNLDAPLERRTGEQMIGRRQPASQPVRGESEQPPEWTAKPLPRPTGVAVSESRILCSVPSQPEAEPVRMADPPRLNSPPSSGDPDNGPQAAATLAVSRMVLCRQVRGYDDVVAIQPQQLRRGQPILVYASLDNFLSIATAKGYRTLTLSTLEIQGADGDMVLRMPLGTAIDLSEVPRQDFFLTHHVTIPENLPAGEYIFELRIDDLQARESSRSQMAVTVTADRTRPDGTGDTSKFATRPDSFLR